MPYENAVIDSFWKQEYEKAIRELFSYVDDEYPNLLPTLGTSYLSNIRTRVDIGAVCLVLHRIANAYQCAHFSPEPFQKKGEGSN